MDNDDWSRLTRRHELVESRMRWKSHVRFGGRTEETDQPKDWHRASVRPNWEDGGPTDTRNLITLCPAHHRAIHRGDYRIDGNPDQPDTLQFIDARGSPIGLRPPRPPGQPPTAAATALGITDARYQTRSGERADWNNLVWRAHPTPDVA